MSTQKLDPDHKRKMVGGVLAAALLFSVVIGSKLDTSQLSAQVGGEDEYDTEQAGCYYKLIDSTGVEVNAWLARCDETGCYYPDGYWDSNGISGTGEVMPIGTYRLETLPNDPNSIVGSDGQRYIPSDVSSSYGIMEGDLCRDENGDELEDELDYGGDPGNEPENCWEEDRGDQICNVCTDGEEEWENECWPKDDGGDRPDPQQIENDLKNMRNQLKDHTKFNLRDLKNLISGREFKTPSGKVKKESGRIEMVRDQLERDIQRNTKLKTMLEEAELPTTEIDESIAWDEMTLDDIYFIEAEVIDLVPRYESDIETIKSLVTAVNPEETTWESFDEVWFELQKTLDPYWSLRDTIDGVVNHTERTNEILDWTFEYQKALAEVSKFGGDVYLDAGLLAELEEVVAEGVEAKNIVTESVDWYKDLKVFADDVWALEFQDYWNEEIDPMRDRQQDFGDWRNDVNQVFDDWRCVGETGDEDEDWEFEAEDDDFGDFEEDFEDEDFDDFDGGSGFCEMDVWRLLEEVRMSAEQGREVGSHVEEIKFMIEAIGQMTELGSMIDTDDPEIENAIDELVRLASDILPVLEEILVHMEAGEFDEAEEKGRGIEETGMEAEEWAMVVIDYCDNNPSKCELTPAVDELLYGGPEDFRDRDEYDDYLGEYYIDEELIQKIVNELLAKFTDDLANQLLAQLTASFTETEMNDLVSAMVDEAIEKTMSVVFNYFDALGTEKAKALANNTSTVVKAIEKFKNLDVADDVQDVLDLIKEKLIASTTVEGFVSKLEELYDAVAAGEDTDAILAALRELVDINKEELIISDGFGYHDVNPENGDWYVEYVLSASSEASAVKGCEPMFKGDTNPDGTKKGTFRPGDSIARNEMLKVGLAASENCLGKGGGAYWDEPYIEAGTSLGLRIAKGHGVDDRAYWGASATREELAWLIYELGANADAGKYNFDDANTGEYNFPDVGANSELGKVAAILKSEKIITGTGEDDPAGAGRFAAEAKTNRAEASKVFTQFKTSLEDGGIF